MIRYVQNLFMHLCTHPQPHFRSPQNRTAFGSLPGEQDTVTVPDEKDEIMRRRCTFPSHRTRSDLLCSKSGQSL